MDVVGIQVRLTYASTIRKDAPRGMLLQIRGAHVYMYIYQYALTRLAGQECSTKSQGAMCGFVSARGLHAEQA